MIFEDQLAALEADSKKVGTQGGELDFALLVDGLAAEREQGITIDVAYRFFSTDTRKFIVADTPGHEQYTRNMVTGASTADLAVILIDARKGVLTQTRRHSYIVSLLGIRHVVLAINKMDLVELLAADASTTSSPTYREFAAADRPQRHRPHSDVGAARRQHARSAARACRGITGPTLMEHLETVEIEDDLQHKPFRLPVQWVNRPNQDFRGFAGTIASGAIRRGDTRARAAVRANEHASRASSTHDGDLRQRGRRPVDHADAGRRDRRQPRRRAAPRPTRRRPSPISSRRRSSGCTTSRCCPAVRTC